jgi:malonyl-CoA O-methyltransferase
MTSQPLPEGFAVQVRQRFARGADRYDNGARLQQGIAWRLARHCRRLELPPGPCADLGAGSGLLSRALRHHRHDLRLLQLDNCPELLARNPLAQQSTAPCADPSWLLWDLNRGLPPLLEGASLLVSNFALQWLADPAGALEGWITHLRPGGWLAITLPTAGCFSAWHHAAAAAGVPCTAMPLPPAEVLVGVAAPRLRFSACRILAFRSGPTGGHAFLGALRGIGADATPMPGLSTGQLRALLRQWPEQASMDWEVLLLVGQKPR